MLLLGISKAPFLTLLCFYTSSPAPRVPLGALAEPPRCSPPSAGPWGPLVPQGQAESAASASLPQGLAGGSREWSSSKAAVQWGWGREELGGSRKNKMCTRGRAGAAPCPSPGVCHGPEMELRWVFPPGNAAGGKGA